MKAVKRPGGWLDAYQVMGPGCEAGAMMLFAGERTFSYQDCSRRA